MYQKKRGIQNQFKLSNYQIIPSNQPLFKMANKTWKNKIQKKIKISKTKSKEKTKKKQQQQKNKTQKKFLGGWNIFVKSFCHNNNVFIYRENSVSPDKSSQNQKTKQNKNAENRVCQLTEATRSM